MNNNRIGRLFRCRWTRERAHGQSFLGIGQRALVAEFGGCHSLQGSAKAGKVHKCKHAAQAAVGRTNQETLGIVEVKHCGGVAVNAHLVFYGPTVDVVVLQGVR